MKQREIQLLMFLFGLFFVAANVVAGLKLVQKKKAIEKEHDRVTLLKADMENLLEGQERYLQYGQWITENQPVFQSRERVEKEMLEAAAGAAEFGVTVTGKDLLEIEELEQAIQAGIWVRADGSLEELLQWFHELQQPETFRVIRKLRLMPGGETGSKLSCEFLLLRWYQANPDANSPVS